MRWRDILTELDHVNDLRNDREYFSDTIKHWTNSSTLDKRPTFTNWPPNQQELRAAERLVLQDPQWLAYYARFGWTSFTRIPDSQWEWSRHHQRFQFREVPQIWYMPKRPIFHGRARHPQGGETSPDRAIVWATLDGKLSKIKSEYSHMEVTLPTVVHQIRDFVAMKAPVIRANLPYLEGQYYIRFGKWPENERSQIFLRGHDKVNPQYERGVSAYHARFNEHEGRWEIEDTMNYETITGTLESLIYGSRDIYLVQGRELNASGSDGEPLLRNVKTVKVLHKHDVFFPGVFDPREDEQD